jgi:hypothetical protein
VLIAFLVCLVWSIGSAFFAFAIAYQFGSIIALIPLMIVPVAFSLAALRVWRDLRIRTRNINWLVRLEEDAVLVNFRWYANRFFLNTGDPVVFRVNLSEIEWLREHLIELKFSINALRTVEARCPQYLEVKLRDPAATLKLKEQLFTERQLFPEPAPWDGVLKKGLVRRFPVTIVDENTVRIEWDAGPGVKSFLRKIAHVSHVIKPQYTRLTLRDIGDRPRSEQDKLLSFLVESGQTNYAIYAIRKTTGNKWTEAEEIQEVRRLSARNVAHSLDSLRN